MTKETDHEQFATVVRRRLHALNITIQAAAERIGVPGVTLRTYMNRNRFTQHVAVNLATLLQLPTTDPGELLATYDFAQGSWARGRYTTGVPPVSLIDAFRVSDRRPPRGTGDIGRFLTELGELVEAMSGSDLAVFCTATVIPPEFEASEPGYQLTRQITQAVARGARFLYIRAGRTVFREYSSEWRFRRLLPVDEVAEEIHDFRAEVARRLSASGMSLREARAAAATRIVQLRCERSPFFNPGFIIGMFQSEDVHHTLHRRMVVRLPGAFTGVIYRRADDVFDGRFSDFVGSVIESVLGGSSGSRKGRQKVVVDAGARAEALDPVRRLLDARYRRRPEPRAGE